MDFQTKTLSVHPPTPATQLCLSSKLKADLYTASMVQNKEHRDPVSRKPPDKSELSEVPRMVAGKGDSQEGSRADSSKTAPELSGKSAFLPSQHTRASEKLPIFRVRADPCALGVYVREHEPQNAALHRNDVKIKQKMVAKLSSFGKFGAYIWHRVAGEFANSEFFFGKGGECYVGAGPTDVNLVLRRTGSLQRELRFQEATELAEACSANGKECLGLLVSLIGFAFPVEGPNTCRLLNSIVPEVSDLPREYEEDFDDLKLYGLKSQSAAKTKTNVWFKNVYASCRDNFKEVTCEFDLVAGYLDGAMNDTASGLLAWFVNAYPAAPRLARYVVANWSDKAVHSSLSNLVKGCGTHADARLAMFAETWSLLGRGIGSVDWANEKKMRLDEEHFRTNCAAKVDQTRLEDAIRRVVHEEMGSMPKYVTPLSHYQARWSWCKSGAHSRRTEREAMGQDSGFRGQMNKRVFAEQIEESMLFKTEPASYFTVMEKLEEGKVRAVYNGDTVSYFNFDYLLRPIERVWRNNRVLLSPSGSFSAAQYAKLGSAKTSYKVMLDYDDFNSQHSLEAQKAVIRIACSNAPQECVNWALKSFDNTWILFNNPDGTPGAEMSHMVGTLLSGHRATTFINSVLNKAYLIVIFGDAFGEFNTYHAGDDVLMMTTNASAVDAVAATLQLGQVRMNRSKQAFLVHEGEFLRIRFSHEMALGYLSRSIASVVSGSWVTTKMLDEEEYTNSMLNLSWTVCNRAFSERGSLFMAEDFKMRMPHLARWAKEVLTGVASVNGSPVRSVMNYVSLDVEIETDKEVPDLRADAGFATQDYLNNHTNHALLKQIGLAPGQLYGLMKEASYAVKIKKFSRVKTVRSSPGTLVMVADVDWATAEPKTVRGRLCDKFPFSFLSGSLEPHTLRALLLYYGYPLSGNLIEQAWGPAGVTVGSTVAQCYSDLRSYGYVDKRTTALRPNFACWY